MITNLRLEQYLNSLMEIEKFEDYVPNGLQVEGCENISRIIASPSISLAAIKRAIEYKAQAILVHHGLFWKNDPKVLRGVYRKKIHGLLHNEINLLAYHLPMDFLPKFGNNEPVLCELDAGMISPFANIGYSGMLKARMECDDFFETLDKYYGTTGVHVPRAGQIQKIAIVSGNGTSFFQQAINEGVDAFITGEGTEWIYQLSRDNNVAYSAMGHYKTECIGPKLLARHLQKKFKLDCELFVEDNPF